MFDYAKLKKRIKEKEIAYTSLANKLNMRKIALEDKLNNFSAFTYDEIFKICNILNINKNEIDEYFFTQKV